MALGLRGRTTMNLVKGVLAGMALTACCMALLALIVVRLGMSDGVLTILNQSIKVCSIFVGALVSVRPGGQRGFATGAVVGLLYMVLGYAIYALLDGALLTVGLLAAEFVMGAALGAVGGAVVANLKPRKSTPRRRFVRKSSAAAGR